MARIITAGTARNLHNTVVNGGLAPDPTERKFVTFTNDLGAVHTVIVDADHAAQDAEGLLKWFERTRTLVEHASHLTPDEVIGAADHHLSTGEYVLAPPAPGQQEQVQQSQDTQTGGEF